MNKAQFNISIKDSERLLKKFELFKSIGPKGNGVYSPEFLKLSKKNNLIEVYKCAIQNFDYDIILFDDSVIQYQFNKRTNDLRYVYIQNPYKFISKEEYLMTLYDKKEIDELTETDFEALLLDINENDYEQFLNEQSLNSTANYFRYDYSKVGYLPLLHSCSHIHIGTNQNIRIPVAKILTPQKFTKFLIKNTYYDVWKTVFEADDSLVDKIGKMKRRCIDLPGEEWTDIEKNELYLS